MPSASALHREVVRRSLSILNQSIGLNLWRNSSSEINDELYKGYWKGNPERKINEIIAAYDFLNSNEYNFNVSIWYNSTYKNDTGTNAMGLVWAPRSVNVASNAYLQFLRGTDTQILFDFVKEMPKRQSKLRLDFSSLLGALFFSWVILQLFPVILTSLVYEKQQKLRIMMKMHGFSDGPYWMISYAYFLSISMIYMLCFVIFGSLIGLKFFTLNDYSIQFNGLMGAHDEETKHFFKHSSMQVLLCPRSVGKRHSLVKQQVYGARPIRRWLEKIVVTGPDEKKLVYRVEKNGGLVNATTGEGDDAQAVKKMKIQEIEEDEETKQ